MQAHRLIHRQGQRFGNVEILGDRCGKGDEFIAKGDRHNVVADQKFPAQAARHR